LPFEVLQATSVQHYRRGKGAAISLEHLLNGLDVAVESLVVSDLRNGWSAGGCRGEAPTVRCALSGGAVLGLAGGATMHITRTSVQVVPPRQHGRAVADETPRPLSARARAERVWAQSPRVETDPDVLLGFGRIRATFQGSTSLFDHLREPLVENLTADDPFRRAFQDLIDEIASQRPGYRAMVEALLRRCLILLLRRLCERDEGQLPWLAPLEDLRLGRAVAAMQERPEHSFTLPALAEVAGMSRSVFAARFADALGQSPIGFLKTLRMARATRLLLGTDLPVKSVSTRVGYSSRSSFTRAFVACHGVGPTAFRAAACEPVHSV
jgi:AraC family transcriptional regulator, activator of mtrCDE